MKALGRRKKSHKKAALEVVKEADKEGEEGRSMLVYIVNSPRTSWAVHALTVQSTHMLSLVLKLGKGTTACTEMSQLPTGSSDAPRPRVVVSSLLI